MSSIDYSNCTDEELIKIVQAGDDRAFNEIVERYRDKLLNYINGFMNEISVSENLVQDTLLKAYTNADKYREIAKFSTWIYTIAKNCALTEYRKIKRRKTFSFSQLSSEDNEFNLERIQGKEDFDLSNDAETYKAIRDAITNLPEEFREIIILKDIQEHSYDEISIITNLALGTVKSRINRGRRKLKEIIEQYRRNDN